MAERESGSGGLGFAVVGLGASAGGLEAAQGFFTAMPADSGMAFVLIQHLDPTHESLTDELLARQTAMPVMQVTCKTRIEPNHVYVIPPNKYLALAEGSLELTEPTEKRGLRMPIDFFLRSLAQSKQQQAIGVILSGTGTDGTLGIREIKAAGGLVVVQDPLTAQFDGMPRSAISTGIADCILPVKGMAEVLVRYHQHPYVHSAPCEEAEPTDQLNTILNILRARSKYDFSCYKKGTLTRRVQRRMGIHHIESMAQYASLLRQNNDEVSALYKDLLISVTNFFREPEAWEELDKLVVTPLVREHSEVRPIRAWVAGCATGEEAYSLAMLFAERCREADKPCNLQLFASDIGQDALATARAGIYPENIVADVPAARLRQFFSKGEHSYRIDKEIRDAVVFAEQNVISDPPFSRLDLICCRNLMIYLEAEVQRKILTMFHFALQPGGFLFLGNSETINQQTDLFAPLSRKWRIYRRLGGTRREGLVFPVAETGHAPRPTVPGIDGAKHHGRRLATLAQQWMLQRLAPAAALINRKGEVLYLNGPVDRYLQLPSGELGADLIAMTREGLRSKLRAALYEAMRDDQTVTIEGVRLQRGRNQSSLRVVVEPLRSPREAEGLLLVSFHDDGKPSPPGSLEDSRPASARDADEQESIIHHLESELSSTREDLQSTIEELEASNEEYKAANEEVTSINEELQSTNEELETSKEELQSLNEELQTVNSQLEEKLDELKLSNDDLFNLLRSSDVPTIFLDRKFHLRRFTPATHRLLRVIDSDLGRPLRDFAFNFTDDALLSDSERVLQTLAPVECQIQDHSGNWYIRRVAPFRTQDDRIEGVVITFVDITRQKADELQLREGKEQLEQRVHERTLDLETANEALSKSDARFRSLLESAPDAMLLVDSNGAIQHVNLAVEEAFGFRREELIGRSIATLIPALAPGMHPGDGLPFARSDASEPLGIGLSYVGVRGDQTRFPVEIQLRSLPGEDGMLSIAAVRDVTNRRQAAEDQSRLAAILEGATAAIIVASPEGDIQHWNRGAEQLFGYSASDAVGRNMSMLTPPGRPSEFERVFKQLSAGQAANEFETVKLHYDGALLDVGVTASLVRDETGRITGLCCMIRDIQLRKTLEHQIAETAEHERQRLGRELHDSLSQQVSGIGLLVATLKGQLPAGPAAPMVEKIEASIENLKRQFKMVIKGMFPVDVDARGLRVALEDLAQEVAEAWGVACRFECPENIELEDNFRATQLYMIAREAAFNAARHAQARQIVVTLTESSQGVQVSVADDGRGFDLDAVHKDGMGLRIMRHRCGLLGGRLTFERVAKGGTLVSCHVERKQK
ncbi:MAG: PAS domain S-box protein [Planctomycetes bacterium]|nr:PAS domain S-box protein [Planctomycetota bacterium]